MADPTESRITVISSLVVQRVFDEDGDECVLVKSSENVTLMEMLGLLEMAKVYIVGEFRGS